MRLQRTLIPVAALALALSSSAWAAAEQRRGSRAADNQERDGAEDSRGGSGARRDSAPPPDEQRQAAPAPPADRGDRAVARRPDRQIDRDDRGSRQVDRRDANRGGREADQRASRGWDVDRNRRNDRWDRGDGRDFPPRVIVPRVAPRRYYGPGGRSSVYFGVGSGYRFGSWYDGRVYGYAAPYSAYGVRRYYGEVRLQVRPRFAEVYVDGYYAGLVDDFDGVFQRLTLEVGPHQIEVAAHGYEPQYFEVYVDPIRTVNLYGDLYPGRPY